MNYQQILAKEFNLKPTHVENVLNLIDEGNTIPFIARYRKELTGNMDDEMLRLLVQRWEYLVSLNERREEILNRLTELEVLTPELEQELNMATTIQRLEDLYRPHRPKRKTRASVAIDKGLEPLAEFMFKEATSQEEIESKAEDFVDPEKDVEDLEAALSGASDIIAEWVSDSAEYRDLMKKYMERVARYVTKAVDPEDISPYEMYAEYDELYRQTPPHRVLAMNRGEKEKKIKVSLDTDMDQAFQVLWGKVKQDAQELDIVKEAALDGFKRLMYPSLEREMRQIKTDEAQEEAIIVFGRNLKPLLMQAPVRGKTVLALDPGFRTGAKVVILNPEGMLLYHDVIYPTEPFNKVEEGEEKLLAWIEEYGVELIAIGNGTASRETEMFVADVLRNNDLAISYTIVNEAGASIYSASELAKDEFPEYDVTVRGAVSIGRRLQDPLAELVKIHPRHLGVGQYQHDLNKERLDTVLTDVVEDCVNHVGVDLNTASSALLNYVAGVSKNVAKNVIAYRDEHGRYRNREQLKEVKGLGPKTYEQCAGFLRIIDGEEPLDNTAVHPESYELAKRLREVEGDINSKALAAEWDVGEYTLNDIIQELEKPGRDPRDEGDGPVFRQDVLSMEDLEEGMKLTGYVRNVVDFGAFVDIGVKEDGLVHISEMAKTYVEDPHKLLQVGDEVEVTIIKLDLERRRIGLSMK